MVSARQDPPGGQAGVTGWHRVREGGMCICCLLSGVYIAQVEYAMEAVKQGSACVGARSKTHAVMAALKRSTNDMSSYQKKIFKVDDHMVNRHRKCFSLLASAAVAVREDFQMLAAHIQFPCAGDFYFGSYSRRALALQVHAD